MSIQRSKSILSETDTVLKTRQSLVACYTCPYLLPQKLSRSWDELKNREPLPTELINDFPNWQNASPTSMSIPLVGICTHSWERCCFWSQRTKAVYFLYISHPHVSHVTEAHTQIQCGSRRTDEITCSNTLPYSRKSGAPSQGVFSRTIGSFPHSVGSGRDTRVTPPQGPRTCWLPAAVGVAASRQECDTVGKETGSLWDLLLTLGQCLGPPSHCTVAAAGGGWPSRPWARVRVPWGHRLRCQ